jgi:hypothetical protein
MFRAAHAKSDECPRATFVEHLGERHLDHSRDSRALVDEPQLTKRRVRLQRANDVGLSDQLRGVGTSSSFHDLRCDAAPSAPLLAQSR